MKSNVFQRASRECWGTDSLKRNTLGMPDSKEQQLFLPKKKRRKIPHMMNAPLPSALWSSDQMCVLFTSRNLQDVNNSLQTPLNFCCAFLHFLCIYFGVKIMLTFIIKENRSRCVNQTDHSLVSHIPTQLSKSKFLPSKYRGR